MSEQPEYSPAAGSGERDEAVEAAAFLHALHRAADGFPPADSRALVSAGYSRGRTLRRRRAAVVTAGAAVLALAGTGGVLATASGHAAPGAAHDVTAASAPSRSATAGAHAVDTSASARPISARQMEDLLASMLPPGSISGRDGRGTDDELPPYAHVVFDDGHGASAIEAIVETDGAAGADCTADLPPGDSCTQTQVHGGVLTVMKTYEYPDHRADTKDWIADFRTPDGTLVEISEWNAPAEKGAPVTRPEPPLSAARLGAVATNPAWRRVAAAERASTPKDSAHATAGTGTGRRDEVALDV
ncbi:hypothetical protein [Actinacidiphila rubida]|uniref:Uncharacterized protein n=1 Tax=Actinacidiphila rubida TaxID=310780 RepID=A0A1H8JLT2_9ACTN|nr:hypothetical protein [Actinacidiphila rubida]SEN81700.1 hypothetical protein SAMN05216267_1010196 [Actinacidiphila rubida]